MLHQGSQTRGPRLSFKLIKLEILIIERQKKDQIRPDFALNMAFFPFCGPHSPPYSKLRPSETFSIQMWPLDGFEFETPVLHNTSADHFPSFFSHDI
jgi:hypothetical protein